MKCADYSMYNNHCIISIIAYKALMQAIKGHLTKRSFKNNRESATQFENQIMPRVYARCIMRRTMYEKAPFC